jgi:mono/diheme cytochrome c family protein
MMKPVFGLFRFLRGGLALLAFAPVLARAAVDPGEILISEMNCVACHKAEEPIKARLASRQSPVLGKDGVRLTPQWVRAFLENPQAEKPGTLMPDMLAGLEPTQRADAADVLTHYLMSLQTADLNPQSGANTGTIKAGEALYHSVGCVACHAPVNLPKDAANNPMAKEELAKLAGNSVPLGNLSKKYTVNALSAFLRDPLKTRPSGRMPALKLSEGEATAIAMYLVRDQVSTEEAGNLRGLNYDFYDVNVPELPEFSRLKPTRSGTVETFTLKAAGKKSNYALQFRGNITIPRDGEYTFYTESDDGSRLYINEKEVVQNNGIHPAQENKGQIKLQTGTHAIRVVYFEGGGDSTLKVSWQGPGLEKQEIPGAVLGHEGRPLQPLGSAPFALDETKVARGRMAFVSLQCANCHGSQEQNWDKTPAVPPARPLAQLTAKQPAGCLATKAKPNVPKFEINDRQRVVILAQLGTQAGLTEALTTEQQINRTLTTLNCYACHARDRRGGIEGLRRDYFITNGEVDLGDEGRIPPHLNGIGAKLKTEAIGNVLWKGDAVRPYMATRMPQFGEANVRTLPELFTKADLPQPPPAEPATNDIAARHGRQLVGTGGLSCIACHNFGGRASLGIPAVDLTTVAGRLRPEWFQRYLLDPQALRPGTRMPTFWPNGVATNKDILGGDPKKQIDAIWAFLQLGKKADLPDGLMQGKQEIMADKEAVIYRHFIAGAGSRAIGVAYPEKANLAFDADGLRLALIWQGPFIDAAKQRTGRGVPNEPPLGRNVFAAPPGPAFAVLANPQEVWPKDLPAGSQFLGYRLDDLRRPTFHYSLSGVKVEDFPAAVRGEVDPAFARTITLRATPQPPGQFYFRAARSDRAIEAQDGGFVIDGKVRMKFPGAKPVTRSSEGKYELLVPVVFANGAAKIVQEIVW